MSSPLQPGQKVGAGRFTLVKPLGRGGMGEVWLAQDERLKEPAALKFLPSEVRADAAALDDLRRETARSHRLTHPNIVRIHDLHEDPDGTAFIVMEYVDGPTMAALRMEHVDRVLQWDFLRPLVQQLCGALDYAHGENVIHRDLKPANIMVDARGRVKLADFGIAAVVSDSMSRVSQANIISGTLVYMSPQQLTGKRPQASDDVYALGATLYELVAGKPPFYTGDLTHQVLNEMPEPLDERLAAAEIKNDIPPDVAALIMACLAKEPAQRPQSTRAMAEWIGLELETKPSMESLAQAMLPASKTKPATKQVDVGRPARAGFGAKLAAVGVVIVVVAGAFWLRKGGDAGNNSTAPLVTEAKPPAQPAPPQPPPPATPEPVPSESAAKPVPAPADASWYQNLSGKSAAAAIPAPVEKEAANGPTANHEWANGLGMRFVSVPGTELLFSVWDARVQDFAAFVKEEGYDATSGNGGSHPLSSVGADGWRERGYNWQNPGFTQRPTSPVCGISWKDVNAFCKWLTDKEHKSGLLTQKEHYRLPKDAEWSIADGLENEIGGTPEEKSNNGKGRNIYPWGNQWPPPIGSGNYAGEETRDGSWPEDLATIPGFRDGYPRTSPVGSFRKNRFGLYDMSGNVWQWCEDSYHGDKFRPLRGGSWASTSEDVVSTCRRRGGPGQRIDDYGFRCVLAGVPGAP